MPQLDVSFVLTDPMFEDQIAVRRRVDVVRQNGRADPMLDRFTPEWGVVTQQAPAELLKTEDGQTIPRRILVCTQCLIVAAAPGRQGDEVTWNGAIFVAVESLPYSQYGEGFYEVICEFRGAVPPVQ